MKKNKKISIITVCYNSEKTIQDTIESVLNQTYDNYEYIIVDGKSKDKTPDIIKAFEQKFKGKLKFISEKDKGIFDAMNKGIKMASGEIIGIINSDDILANKDVFKTINSAFDDNVDAVYSDLNFYNDDFTKVVRRFKTGKGSVKRGWHPPHPTLYLTKKVYDEVGYYNLDYKICSDGDFMIRVFMNNKYKSKYLETEFVKMRAGGVSTDGLKGYVRNYFEAVKVYRNNNIKFPYTVNAFRSIKTIFQMLKR